MPFIKSSLERSHAPLWDEILQVCEHHMHGLMFGDYLNPDALPEERKYEEVTDLEDFQRVVHVAMEEYNNTHKSHMDLVIFRYATWTRRGFSLNSL